MAEPRGRNRAKNESSLQAITLTLILDREPRWFERRVKEGIYIKVNKPTLNKDGGRYKLPGVYESILRSSVPKVTTWGAGKKRRRV